MMTNIKNANDLAVFSGKPAFNEKLHVGRPNIGNRDSLLNKLNDILDRRWLTNNGLFVQAFERNLAEMLQVRHCIVMCNATIALEITTRALGLKHEVIVPSFTFIATPHSLKWQEITPIFCDIDPKTHNIDPTCIEKLITPRTTGIVGVHLWGRPCAVEALVTIAQRYDLKLMFDAAHAFGCSHKNRMIGGFGDAEVFSFHATKFFNTFEGGAVATNNDELAAKIRLMKNFGFAGYDNVIYIGTNGKMNEFSAAMGLTGLESLDEFIAVNHRNYQKYQEGLAGIPGIVLVRYDEVEKNNFQYVVCEVDEQASGISRDMLLKILHAENIIARRYFYPGCHKMEPYRSDSSGAGPFLPHTDRLVQRVLSLPTGTAVGHQKILKICQIIRLAVSHGPDIMKKLAPAG
jgi:dTDP-4-amino-4,6-dideoxygalactose transaminase